HVGGYQDYLEQRPEQTVVDQKSEGKQAMAKADAEAAPVAAKEVKLSYKDQSALEQLPAEMEALEKEQAEINAQLADGSVFVTDCDKALKLSNRLSEIDELLLEKLERWEELDNLSNG